jgi:hypothetical protein
MARLFNNTVFILIMVFLLAGCNLDFLSDSDDEDSTSVETYTYSADTALGTYSCYDSDGSLYWTEYYDFDQDVESATYGKCTFIQRELASGTVLWSKAYEWKGDNLVGEAYYDENGTLDYFNYTVWDGDNASQYLTYDSDSNLESGETWTYDSDENITLAAGFDEDGDQEWAYSYEYTDGNLTTLSYYDAMGDRAAIIASEYDDSDQITLETGYGDCTSESSFSSSYSGVSFSLDYDSSNETVYNTDNLTFPEENTYTLPTLTSSTSVVDDLDYAWLSVWYYDDYGYTSATLNESYYPISLSRYAPDYLDGLIEIDMEYSTIADVPQLISKEITYDGDSVLVLDFDYDDEGHLTDLSTSGEALTLDLDYAVTYYDSGVPESLSIATSGVTLQTLTFSYGELTVSDLTFDSYLESIATLYQYDGDGEPVGSYDFSFGTADSSDGTYDLTLTVYDAEGTEDTSDDTENGSIVLAYDSDDLIASLTSYDSEGTTYWSYEYSYSDLVEDVTSAADEAEGTISVLIGEDYFDDASEICADFGDSDYIDLILSVITDLDLSQYIPVEITD